MESETELTRTMVHRENITMEGHHEDGDSKYKDGETAEGFSQELSSQMRAVAAENLSVSLDTPLLHRVDMLDKLLSSLEEKYSPNGHSYQHSPPSSARRSSGPPTPSSLERHCKPAEDALEETEEKGSLLERVSSLERKVLELSQSFQKSMSSLSGRVESPKTRHADNLVTQELPVAYEKEETVVIMQQTEEGMDNMSKVTTERHATLLEVAATNREDIPCVSAPAVAIKPGYHDTSMNRATKSLKGRAKFKRLLSWCGGNGHC